MLMGMGAALARAEALAEKLEALLALERFAEAQAVAVAAVAADPDDAEARHYAGLALLGQNKPEEALPYLAKAVALAPTSRNHVSLGDAYGMRLAQAPALSRPGLAKQCRAAYAKAVELDPKNVHARMAMIRYLRAAPGIAGGGPRKAWAAAVELERIDPLLSKKARADLLIDDRSYEAAHALLAEILRGHPGDYMALFAMGRLATESGAHTDDGLAALQKCLAETPPPEQPGHSFAHWRIGQLLEQKGDKAGAKAAYESALKIRPGLKAAREALDKLE
ncbi:MAG: tetratricopeptide repeat protein [Opitutaceae bacterium]|jgi:tetratricopeptide (TPR) repeat protein|nr:tetratricopeptide repeat protein [Opitutaceae bacterium]